jgi:hypothetical protein
MTVARLSSFFAVILLCLSAPVPGWSFSFSEQEQQEASEESSPQTRTSLNLLNCPKSIRSAKIATMIGEIHRRGGGGRGTLYGSFLPANAPDWDSYSTTNRSVYGNLVDELNSGFQQLGLKTYTATERAVPTAPWAIAHRHHKRFKGFPDSLLLRQERIWLFTNFETAPIKRGRSYAAHGTPFAPHQIS